MKNIINTARRVGASTAAKVGTGLSAVMASGAAFASGSGSPGSAIAGELAGGKAEIGLVVAACAVLIGLILLWSYTRRAAK
ncbi:hypothetical protein [Stenotrophomonas sp. CFBP 13725]|uniref:hypothetical protein n=1 Tax=Stenotrophomonas sp. CFBP 13725 TaxID=2775297 RepID=UPI00177C16C6|nr:hypothetical protein [Stenotrophomonas sp. CFBP 13725]MBD8634471.1 hypothetical protein [Stenotrophomonas sp. CFBP 13725]